VRKIGIKASNPPKNMLQKVELIVKTAFEKPQILRYRELYCVGNAKIDEE
jgi:hypothetical protein